MPVPPAAAPPTGPPPAFDTNLLEAEALRHRTGGVAGLSGATSAAVADQPDQGGLFALLARSTDFTGFARRSAPKLNLLW